MVREGNRANAEKSDSFCDDCDECAAADDSFRGDGGGLCDSGDGEEGVEVSKFTESFWGRKVMVFKIS